MKKYFISTLLVLFAVCSVKAQQDTIKVHVDGTSLESLLEDYDKGSISYLSITGKLSEDDYAFIRDSLLKSLDVLDLKNAEIDSLPKNAFNCKIEYAYFEYIPMTQIVLPELLEYVSDNAIALKSNRWKSLTFVITGQYPDFADYNWRNSYPEIKLRVSDNNLSCKEVEMIHENYPDTPISYRCICSTDTTVLYYQDIENCIGDVMEGVRIISSNAFENSRIIETTTFLPSTLDSIGDRAFYNIHIAVSTCCKQDIFQLVCKSINPPKLGKEVFKSDDKFTSYDESIDLYVPDESVEIYKATDGWSEFSKILPISKFSYPRNNVETIKRINVVEIKYDEESCVLQLSKPASRMMVYDVDGTQILNKKITSQAIQLSKSLFHKPYSLAVIAFTDGTTEVVKLKHGEMDKR